jgi:hypothetical protein
MSAFGMILLALTLCGSFVGRAHYFAVSWDEYTKAGGSMEIRLNSPCAYLCNLFPRRESRDM